MKTIIWLFCTCLFVSSCSTSTPKTDASAAATQLSIPPELMLSLSQITICEQNFWYSKYGQQVANKETVDIEAYFTALETKPKTCSISQFIGSTQKAAKVKRAIEKDQSIAKDSAQKNIQKVKTLQKALTSGQSSITETLFFAQILEQLEKNIGSTKDKQLALAISEAKNSFVAEKQNIFKTAVSNDLSVYQNTIYHMEIPDWQVMNLGILPRPMTSDQIHTVAKTNKYDEVLKIEKFKNKILENSKCISDETCFICKAEIQAQKCEPYEEQEQSIDKLYVIKYEETAAAFSKIEKRFKSKSN